MSAAAEQERLYIAYHDKVSAYVRGKIQDPHEAEDVVSAIFLKACQRWDTYDPTRASLSTWLYAITRSAVTDHYRTRRVHVEYEDYMDTAAPAEEDEDDLLDCLADALLGLKARERDLIILHYYKGHTLKKTAELMDMSYINAKVVHKKALSALRATMGAR